MASTAKCHYYEMTQYSPQRPRPHSPSLTVHVMWIPGDGYQTVCSEKCLHVSTENKSPCSSPYKKAPQIQYEWRVTENSCFSTRIVQLFVYVAINPQSHSHRRHGTLIGSHSHSLLAWVTSGGWLDLTNESIEHPVKFEIQMNNKQIFSVSISCI